MSESRSEADITEMSDRTGPKCREVFGSSVITTLWQDFPVAIGPERSSRPSANRKRPHPKPRVLHSVRGEIGSWDLLSSVVSRIK